jgi:hypothetical protein
MSNEIIKDNLNKFLEIWPYLTRKIKNVFYGFNIKDI